MAFWSSCSCAEYRSAYGLPQLIVLCNHSHADNAKSLLPVSGMLCCPERCMDLFATLLQGCAASVVGQSTEGNSRESNPFVEELRVKESQKQVRLSDLGRLSTALSCRGTGAEHIPIILSGLGSSTSSQQRHTIWPVCLSHGAATQGQIAPQGTALTNRDVVCCEKSKAVQRSQWCTVIIMLARVSLLVGYHVQSCVCTTCCSTACVS